MVTKKQWFMLVCTVYIVTSGSYIGYRLWQDFVDKYSTQAYALGKADTIQAIVSQASDGTCKPVTVYNSSKQVQLIDTTCLTAANSATTTTDSTPTSSTTTGQ